jgi:hypothetical protein
MGESPTIVTFINPIISEKPTEATKVAMASEGKLDSGCGRHLAWLSLTPQTTKSVLRIRVKNTEEEVEEVEDVGLKKTSGEDKDI